MRNHETSQRTDRRWRGTLLALVTLLCVTLETRAQMLPFVPDPVTTPELVKYADMLGLSDEQRLQTLVVHDAYRRDFRELEDGKVRVFIGDLLQMGRAFTRGGFRIPERSEFESLIEQFDEIIANVNALDRRLFDRMSGILTETQLVKLPSARTERELDVYGHLMEGPGGLNPGAPIVLSSVVRRLDLSDAEVARTEEPLRQYERNAIRRTRNLYRLLEEAAEFALDTLDRTGLRDMTPMEMMQLGEDEAFQGNMRAAFDDGSKPLQAELFAASQQNLRLLKQLTPLLSPENGEALRDQYYRRAFGRVYQARSSWRQAYERALACESLAGERRQQVEGQRDQARVREDQLVDRIVQRVEAAREYRTTEQLDGENQSDLEDRIEVFREEREAVGNAARSALMALLTPEEIASVERDERDDERTSEPTAQVAVGGGDGRAGDTEVVVESDGGGALFRLGAMGMSPAMSAATRDRLAVLADVDEGQRAVLDAMYDDYREEYHAALERMAQEDEPGGQAGAGAKEEADRLAAQMATLAAMDEALFESIELALPGERVDAAVRLGRALRARERATTAAARSSFVFGREESYVDLVGVVLAMETSVEIATAVRPMIEEYAEVVGPLVEERLDAVRETQRRMRMMSGMSDQGLGGNLVKKTLEDKLDEARRKVRKLDRRIRDENRRRLEGMMGGVDDALWWTLRMAYMREAFPDIYEDELGLDKAVGAVGDLDDLTARQSEKIEGIIYDYRAEFARLSERMVQFRRKRDFDFTAMDMPSQEVLEGEIELERLRFDRREAGARAILRLRLVLDESQIARSKLRELPVGDRRAFD